MTSTIFFLLCSHWVADFVMQTDEEATHKSKSIEWLTLHAIKYTLYITALMAIFISFKHGSGVLLPYFIIINGLSHWSIDYFTSRVNSHFWTIDNRHWFFTGIGFDQFLHTVILLSTVKFLV